MFDNRVEWSPGMSIDEIEMLVIQAAFRHFRNNKSATSRSLGISVRTLENKLEIYEELHKKAEVKTDERTKQYASELDRARGYTVNQFGGLDPLVTNRDANDGRLKPLGSYAKKPEALGGLPTGAGNIPPASENGLPGETGNGSKSASEVPAQQPMPMHVREEVQSVLPEQTAPTHQQKRRR